MFHTTRFRKFYALPFLFRTSFPVYKDYVFLGYSFVGYRCSSKIIFAVNRPLVPSVPFIKYAFEVLRITRYFNILRSVQYIEFTGFKFENVIKYYKYRRFSSLTIKITSAKSSIGRENGENSINN